MMQEENEEMEREYGQRFNWLIVAKRISDYTGMDMFTIIETRTVDEVLTVFSMMETEWRVARNRDRMRVTSK